MNGFKSIIIIMVVYGISFFASMPARADSGDYFNECMFDEFSTTLNCTEFAGDHKADGADAEKSAPNNGGCHGHKDGKDHNGPKADKPGHGYGDKGHNHGGPPGQEGKK